jgi:hypothetical protein
MGDQPVRGIVLNPYPRLTMTMFTRYFCEHCGNFSSCFGQRNADEEPGFSCDICCKHNHDHDRKEEGWCEPLGDELTFGARHADLLRRAGK